MECWNSGVDCSGAGMINAPAPGSNVVSDDVVI